jgi:hypothetical protein
MEVQGVDDDVVAGHREVVEDGSDRAAILHECPAGCLDE